ncbi:hypothetical protein Tco_1097428 [Tanacetum coccineum]
MRFKLDRHEIVYTVDMFRSTLQLPVETPANPFITPSTIKVIEPFMQTVGYQGVCDKVNAFYTKFLTQPWQTMFKKKDVLQYPRFTKLIITDLMKKYPSIPQRLEEDYHSIKYDILLVSVYSTGDVIVRGMFILDAFITDEIRATEDYKEYETVFARLVPMIQLQSVVSTQGTHRTTPSIHRSPTLSAVTPKKKRKQVARETSSPRKSVKVTIKQKKQSTTLIPPPSDDQERDDIAEATLLKEEEIAKMAEGDKDEESYASELANSMLNDDDDDSDDNKDDDGKKDDTKDKDNDDQTDHTLVGTQETGSMETRKEKMQTPIPSHNRSPRKNLSLNKTLSQELTETVSPSTATTSKAQRKTRRISSKYNHIP